MNCCSWRANSLAGPSRTLVLGAKCWWTVKEVILILLARKFIQMTRFYYRLLSANHCSFVKIIIQQRSICMDWFHLFDQADSDNFSWIHRFLCEVSPFEIPGVNRFVPANAHIKYLYSMYEKFWIIHDFWTWIQTDNIWRKRKAEGYVQVGMILIHYLYKYSPFQLSMVLIHYKSSGILLTIVNAHLSTVAWTR